MWFYVYVDNHLTVNAVGDTDRYVALNATETLEVCASCDSGNISYQWYRNDELIDGATEATYTTEPITEYTEYYCRVSDDYGTNRSVSFCVNVIDLTSAKPLVLCEPQTVSIEGYEGNYELFSFVPETSGWYAFIGDEAHADGNGKFGTLLDSELKQISTMDQYTSFRLMCNLTAETQYYFMTGYAPGYSGGSYSVVLEVNDALNSVQALDLDTTATANITEGGQIAYFSFTPEETGYYEFSSINEDTDGKIGYAYDENMYEINNGYGYNEFHIPCHLTEGKTYYFGARYLNSDRTGSFGVLLERFEG